MKGRMKKEKKEWDQKGEEIILEHAIHFLPSYKAIPHPRGWIKGESRFQQAGFPSEGRLLLRIRTAEDALLFSTENITSEGRPKVHSG
jgi:hypothetical protein